MSDFPSRHASPDHPISDLIAKRWSPYVFDPRPVEREKLQACLEAARWAASSYNEQPWRFVIAFRENEQDFQKLWGCLMEGNQPWAAQAGVLMLNVVRKNFARNNQPNRVAEHDLGLAMGNFSLQATELGLAVHQMGGVNLSQARQAYAIPEDYAPVTAVAVGYAAAPEQAVDPSLGERDQIPRKRKPLSEFVFQSDWEKPAF